MACRTCNHSGRPGYVPTPDGGSWQECPDCTARNRKSTPSGMDSMMISVVVGILALGLVGYVLVRVFDIDTTSGPSAPPELDRLYGRGTDWRGTLDCTDGERRVRMTLIVAPGDASERVDTYAVLRFDPPGGESPGSLQGIAGEVDGTEFVLDEPDVEIPDSIGHFLSSYAGTLTAGRNLRIEGPVESSDCSSLRLRDVTGD